MSISLKKYRPYVAIIILIVSIGAWDAYRGVHVDRGIGLQQITTDIYTTDIAGELLISPYGVQDRLLDIFADTRYSIDFRLYQFTETKTQQLFTNLLQTGREMRRISEDRPYGGASKDYEKYAAIFEREGGDARSDRELKLDTNFNHTKTFLIDETTAIISTANLSYSSMTRNREYRFVTQDEGILDNLAHIFESDRLGDPVSMGAIHPALLVCPIDCRNKLEEAIKGAESSIYIQAQYIQDDRVAGLLLAQAKKGVDVSVMVSENQDVEFLEDLIDMENDTNQGGNIQVMIVPKNHDTLPYIHSKNMLIDEKTLYMGSMNFSSNGLDNNREIGIATTNENLVRRFLGQWERDVEAF